ncbi:MAG TPA: amino acid ABC transporter substrate-binding protein [Chloroflexota bacterium]|jgi:branched-chain amino acid transport system substrate-binding protein
MRKSLGIGALTLLLAACGGGGTTAPASSAAAQASAPAAKPAASAPASAAAASAKPAASGGASASAKPAASGAAAGNFDGTLLIGAPMSLTGSFNNEGKLTKDGYDLWSDIANSKGGVNVGGKHYKVEIKYYDDQSKQDQSALLTEKLISQDKVAFMLGPYGTPSNFAASAISEKAKMPMVITGGAANNIYDRGFKYIVGVLSPGTKYLTGVEDAWLASSPKPEKLAVMAANDAFSLEVAKAAADYGPTKGLPVVYNQSYPPDTKDLSSALNQIKASGADVLLGAGHLDDSLVLLKQVKSLGLNFKAVGLSVGPSTPEFSNALGKDGDYVYSGVQWVPEQKSTGPVIGSAQDYTAAFKAKYNQIPEYHNAEATAGGVILQLAIEKAGTLDKDKVRDTLVGMNVDTFFGHTQFDSRGLNSDKPMVVIQLQNGGKQIPVWPQADATGKLNYPAPAWDKR